MGEDEGRDDDDRPEAPFFPTRLGPEPHSVMSAIPTHLVFLTVQVARLPLFSSSLFLDMMMTIKTTMFAFSMGVRLQGKNILVFAFPCLFFSPFCAWGSEKETIRKRKKKRRSGGGHAGWGRVGRRAHDLRFARPGADFGPIGLAAAESATVGVGSMHGANTCPKSAHATKADYQKRACAMQDGKRGKKREEGEDGKGKGKGALFY